MVLAALGEREPKGPMSEAEKRQARRQATGVWIRSIVTGIVATVIVWLVLLLLRPGDPPPRGYLEILRPRSPLQRASRPFGPAAHPALGATNRTAL